MQSAISVSYQKHINNVKSAADKSRKRREDYVISRVKEINADRMKKKILSVTEKGSSRLVIFSVPTKKSKWFGLSDKNLWTINRSTLENIIINNNVQDQLRDLLGIPDLKIIIGSCKLRAHEYHEYDVSISWPLVSGEPIREESSEEYTDYSVTE